MKIISITTYRWASHSHATLSHLSLSLSLSFSLFLSLSFSLPLSPTSSTFSFYLQAICASTREFCPLCIVQAPRKSPSNQSRAARLEALRLLPPRYRTALGLARLF
jgi:hypothetical protein